jgi:hypothetical protein
VEYKNRGDAVVEAKQDEATVPGVPTTFPFSSLHRPFRIRVGSFHFLTLLAFLVHFSFP